MGILQSFGSPAPSLVRIGSAIALPTVLQQRGVDADRFMRCQQIDPRLFDDPEKLIAYPVLVNLLSIASEQANCPHLGLLVGQAGSLASLEPLKNRMRRARTVHSALNIMCETFRSYERGASVDFTTPGDAMLHYVIADPQIRSGDHVCDGAVAMAYMLMRDICGQGWAPEFIELPRRVPADTRPYTQLFRCRVEFNAPVAALHFSTSWLDKPIVVTRRCTDAIQDVAPARDEEDVVGLVRGLVSRRLLSGMDTSAQDIAQALGMSRRTLHRHLARMGATYRDLIEDARYATARRLMRDTDMPLTQLAMALGYSELSGLTRAFSHWSGMSPSAWRGSECPTRTSQ